MKWLLSYLKLNNWTVFGSLSTCFFLGLLLYVTEVRINNIWSKSDKFRGIKSGPVALLGFLSVKLFLTVETIQHKTKNRHVRCLLVRVKVHRRGKTRKCIGAQVDINDGQGAYGCRHAGKACINNE